METIWIADDRLARLQSAGLATFDEVMATTAGECKRVLNDRENWYLPGGDTVLSTRITSDRRVASSAAKTHQSISPGLYLKKHRERTWLTRLASILHLDTPRSPGRIEAENAAALNALGIDVMPLTAYGEKLHGDGRLESFLLSEELEGYSELQDFIEQRFSLTESLIPEGYQKLVPGREATRGTEARESADPRGVIAISICDPSGVNTRKYTRDRRCAARPPANGFDPSGVETLRRIIFQVADIARRFHAAGFNHRDFYCCHFLVKEVSPGEFDVRLIDLQRVQRRRWLRRRWIVKDLAQLASMSPDSHIGCREKVLFLRTYLGVKKLRPQDKRLVCSVLRKLASIRRHTRIITRRVSEGPSIANAGPSLTRRIAMFRSIQT